MKHKPSQLREHLARSKEEKKDAMHAKDKAAADVACALRIRANSEQEVLKVQEDNEKVRVHSYSRF